MSLKEKAVSGVKWTGVSSIIIAVIQILQLSVLARYLDPSDFGLMAIVSVIIGFSAFFMDFGVSAAIIHRQDISHEELSSLYWLNIAAGLGLFLLIFYLAPYIAQFYKEDMLVPLIRLLALTFIISSVGNQYHILFQKALRFEILAKISIVSMLGGLVVAVWMAVNHYGVYALVYAALVNVFMSNLIFVWIGIKEHRPSFVYEHNKIKPMITFGMFRMGEGVINYFNSQFDVILIGKLLGTEALGIYSIAKNLSMRPAQIINPVITKVTFPVMAKVQDDTLQLKNIYLKTINYLSSVNFPVYILMAILAEPIVYILFGDKWDESIVILQILAVYGALRSTGNPVGSLQLAKGRADLGFYWNLVLFFVIPLSIYIGSFWGLEGVAYSLLGLMLMLLIPNWYFMIRPLCGAGFNEYFWQMTKPFLISSVSAFAAYVVHSMVGSSNVYINAGIIFIIMGVMVLLLNHIYNRTFVDMLLSLLHIKNRG